jgi:hypothetical protein
MIESYTLFVMRQCYKPLRTFDDRNCSHSEGMEGGGGSSVMVTVMVVVVV